MSAENSSKVWSPRPTRNIPGAAEAGGFAISPGFVQRADNRMYEELRTAVLAEERQRRISLGLSPDPPNRATRFKNWILKREERSIGTNVMQPVDIEIKKSSPLGGTHK